MKRDGEKEGTDLNAVLVNLAKEKTFSQLPRSTPKLCSDAFISKNSSYCFNKQAILDENADCKTICIWDGLLSIKEEVNDTFQNSYTTSESILKDTSARKLFLILVIVC